VAEVGSYALCTDDVVEGEVGDGRVAVELNFGCFERRKEGRRKKEKK